MENNELGINEVRAFIFEIINSMSEAELRLLLKELEERKNRERRKHGRKDFFMTVDYIVEDRYFQDFIQDMSNSGVFIKTSQTFSEGQTILMTFMSPDNQQPFKINGKIVRVMPDGIGVKFKIENQVLEAAIKSLVNMIQSG
jgi:Tfp pilus assembly protein PilZ